MRLYNPGPPRLVRLGGRVTIPSGDSEVSDAIGRVALNDWTHKHVVAITRGQEDKQHALAAELWERDNGTKAARWKPGSAIRAAIADARAKETQRQADEQAAEARRLADEVAPQPARPERTPPKGVKVVDPASTPKDVPADTPPDLAN